MVILKNMINKYPYFSKLDLSQKDQINQITGKFAPYSDFNFTSLFCWDVDSSTEISLLNDNLVIRMPDYLDGHLLYSILGDNMIDESVIQLLSEVNRLELVPDVVVDSIKDHSRYHIVEDRDSFDYIYNLKHLSQAAGNKFKKKRNKANVFVKDHGHLELEVRTVRQLDDEHRELLRHIDRQWAAQTPREEGDILPERKALDIILDNFDGFRAIVFEILVDGEIKAFSINEVIDDKYAICHFEKALKVHHENIYTFLAIEVAKLLVAETGCQWVNWEQDLGLEGLRRSKSSYHPDHMLKKFTVSLAQPI